MDSRVLHLTSPWTGKLQRTGAERQIHNLVAYTQTLLREGKFGNFHPGRSDGIYGIRTAAAVQRSKFRIGFPMSEVNQMAGDILRKYLKGTASRTPAMVIRARARVEQPSMADAAVKLLEQQVGHGEEPPGSNENIYTRWYGMIGPWCAIFDTWGFVLGGHSKAFIRGRQWAYVPYILRDAREGTHGLRLLSAAEARRGDLMLFFWRGLSFPGETHVEVIRSRSGDVFHTVGGNVGDKVTFSDRTTRSAANVYFVRVGS